MVVSYQRSALFDLVAFKQGERYSIQQLRNEFESQMLSVSDEQFGSIRLSLENDTNVSFKESSYQFDFVGGITFRVKHSEEYSSRNIAIFVYPKWHTPPYDDDFEVMEQLMIGFGKYFSKPRKSERTSTLEQRQYRVDEDFSSHIFTPWLSLINDTNKYGYITEKYHVENNRLGKANWKSTFSKTPPILMKGIPQYLTPIRNRNGRFETIITEIHKETYSFVMTQLSRFFPMKKQMKFNKINSIRSINKKRVILRDSIENCSSFILKQRLEILLSVIEESSSFQPNSRIRFGISSKGMDYFWEEMLLQTLGSESRLNEINEAIQPLQIVNEAGGQHGISDRRKHKLDGVANFDSNSLNLDIILFDAKHYSEWDTLSIDDITKQYAYERAIASNVLINYRVRKNCFIYPMIDTENSSDNVITNRGNYSLTYLEDTDTPQLQIIELNPYRVLESYSKSIEHNLVDELRSSLR